jgi:signal transduction histidine kinase
LLAVGWLAEVAGVPASIWGPGFLLVMLIAVPVSIAIAILRHDLYDLDRLVGSSVTWIATSVVSALIFAGATYAVGTVIGADSRVSVPTAAFVTALVLLPLHRIVHGRVDRLIDRERAVMFGEVDRFVTWVRDGEVEPEAVEALLRTVLRDDGLRLLLCAPGEDQYVDMQGRPATPASPTVVALHSNQTHVGVLTLSSAGRRARRQAAAVAVRARLPIEMARLRLELRGAVAEVTASRARLLVASTTERRRLERDLHDGAQQQIVAVGMRLRSIQRTVERDHRMSAELDAAVDALESTVKELCQLAHGVRPARLNDGLAAGIHDLVATSPIPVEVSVPDLDLPEQTITTIYFVVSEAVTNVWKHARASRLRIVVTDQEGSVAVEVCDDGVGGADPGFGITSIRDRVAALGGQVQLISPAGGGTTVLVTV